MDIRNVKSILDLIGYFSENLGWDIILDDFETIEDISYSFSADAIGLKEEAFAKISSLRQLRPLTDNQKWGIFCIEFDSNKFEVTALRKILSQLVPSRRNATNHAVWDKKDLLFLCMWGQDDNRTIGIAHFEDNGNGLPQIRMISCAPAMEDFTQIQVFENRLSQLKWPRDTTDVEKWREKWSEAFVTAYRQVIQDSSTLTNRLAIEAQNICKRVLAILKVESPNGYVHLLFAKFREMLIHDMKEKDFADMYAQTVVYGLFSARCMDPTQDNFSLDEAINCIPNTNPFLRSLMQECLGTQNTSKLSFDELEISDIVNLLRCTNTEAIIQDFNRQTGDGKEDPVIHFYEEFLTAYDKKQKVERGVFYTPQPIVNFIVRSVDYILKEEFGLKDGLASTETKKIKRIRQSKRKIDGYKREVEEVVEVPAIQVLDPATGTGTFIRQTILQIYDNFMSNHASLTESQKKNAWNEYVPAHLLPRLNAFELMMAPYAVAHMKLAMVLKDTGYNFGNNVRLNVFLTNSLEKPGSSEPTLFDDPLAIESIQANSTKKNNGINIVIGNPPYSGESANNGAWITDLINDYKNEPGKDTPIQERNIKWINDDYVKFIRYAQTYIEQSDSGILAYINPHGFLDNPSFRGMRWFLLKSFSSIYVLDLHGNTRRREACPDGSKDENVFDIQQGVCIFIAIKNSNARGKCRVYHADMYGKRKDKYTALNNFTFSDIQWKEVFPSENNFLFIDRNLSRENSWNSFFSIEEAFPINGVGICSKRDSIAYQNTKEELIKVLNDFSLLSEENLKEKYNIRKESRDQKVRYAKSNVVEYKIQDVYIRKCLYRPFDEKWTYYTDKCRGFLAYPVYAVLKHMLHENVALICSRQGQAADDSNWNVVFCTDKIVDLNIFRRGGGCIFPLYIYSPNFGSNSRKPNISENVISNFSNSINIFYNEKKEDTDESENCFGPLDFWHYIYAILNSNNYRESYKDFLNIEFPRIPYPCDKEVFWKLVKLGKLLKKCHIGQSDITHRMTNLNEGNNLIQQVRYTDGKVYINRNQFFSNVSENIWNYKVGGDQPLEKYLKDRKETTLGKDEIETYCKIVDSIGETIEIMQEIDKIYEA